METGIIAGTCCSCCGGVTTGADGEETARLCQGLNRNVSRFSTANVGHLCEKGLCEDVNTGYRGQQK